MKTRITEMFGIERPIMQGGMHFVGFAELPSVVAAELPPSLGRAAESAYPFPGGAARPTSLGQGSGCLELAP